jgi:diguanylate cyclase (GGDEF)-like protein
MLAPVLPAQSSTARRNFFPLRTLIGSLEGSGAPLSSSVRRLIGTIGLLVSLVVAGGAPIGFALETARDKAKDAAFQAALNADYISRYAAQAGAAWLSHRDHLHDVIEINLRHADRAGYRVMAGDGSVVLDEGKAVAGPTIVRSAPVVVGGVPAGRVEVIASLRPVLANTGLVFLPSLALALVIYLLCRTMPLRLLDRTVGALEARSDVALNNVPQGLAMFDVEKRLLLCNPPYAAMYGLPEHLTKPGTSLHDILDFRKSRGNAPIDFHTYATQHADLAAKGDTTTFRCELEDGRVIRIGHRPMPQGGYVALHDDITDAIRAEAQIAHMAHHDALTGLPNRVRFRQELDRAMTRARRGEHLSVLCLDLDHFKAVNDTLGHSVGDALLTQVAERLRGCLRETDTVARLGGDEFAIVQVGTEEPHHSVKVAERIIKSLSAPYEIEGHQVVIGTSVGISVAPEDSDDPDRLLTLADMALYRSKAEGRGTYRFFEAGMDAKMQARRMLELDLRKALPNGEFEIHYQPLVSLETNRVSGFEALLRWNHPERGWVSPADFIPLAEDIGLINPIGAWVLHQACAAAAAWPRDIKIAVNLSSTQFKGRSLVADVISALTTSGLAAHRLELEITESVVLHDTEATLAILHQLRDLGVRISMDDFGTGYSSLSYLRKFPFDKIKIDRSFISDLPEKASSGAIVKAITGMSTSLGMSTTAEGVETMEQLAAVRLEGCTEVQGYFFSRPRPASEAADLIASIGAEARQAA